MFVVGLQVQLRPPTITKAREQFVEHDVENAQFCELMSCWEASEGRKRMEGGDGLRTRSSGGGIAEIPF